MARGTGRSCPDPSPTSSRASLTVIIASRRSNDVVCEALLGAANEEALAELDRDRVALEVNVIREFVKKKVFLADYQFGDPIECALTH